MATIDVPKALTLDIFDRLSAIYLAHSNIAINMPPDLTESEIRSMFSVLVARTPLELAYVLLADLAEADNAPLDLLEELFDKGDTACRMSICLRDDLNNALLEKCQRAPESEVREHFLLRKNPPT